MRQIGRQLPVLQATAKRTSGVAIATAAGAVLCGVCCAMPFALSTVAAATSGGVLAWFTTPGSWTTALPVAIVGTAWIWIAVKSWKVQSKPAAATIIAMGIATVILIMATVLPRIESVLIAMLKN